jgi:membrane-associated protein
METFIDLFLHLDQHLAEFVQQYGEWVYGLLFTIVFCETGLVVTPFLPGDSLLFAAGALAGTEILNGWLVAVVLAAAAILGDQTNYFIGRFAGPRVFRAEDTTGFWHKVLNRKHLDRARAFFEKYGGRAIFLGHFVPIVRTFVPFVAGAGSMYYPRFAFFNITGVLAWVGICVGAGYLFGNVPIVKNNFSIAVLGVVAVSLMPIAIEYVRSRRHGGAALTDS